MDLKGENKVLTLKTDNLEITKMLTLSTTHINPKTCSFLDSENIDIPVYKKAEYGWFVFVDLDNEDLANLPNDLREIINYTKSNNCEWLCLDRDASISDEIPVYEW